MKNPGDKLRGIVARTPDTTKEPPEPAVPAPREPVHLAAAGEETIQQLIPEQCRPWRMHDRTERSLTKAKCADLMASILREGHNHVPIIVRPVDSTNVRYEVIAGARRHFCVSELVQQGHTAVRLMGVVRHDLSDQAAYAIMNLENHDRTDISPYGRAKSYERAVAELYDSWAILGEALGIKNATLYRYKTLSTLSEQAIAVIDEDELTLRTGLELVTALKALPKAKADAQLRKIARAQWRRRDANQPPIDIHNILRRLQRTPEHAPQNPETKYTDSAGKVILTWRQAKKKNAVLSTIVIRHDASNEGLRRAVEEYASTLNK